MARSTIARRDGPSSSVRSSAYVSGIYSLSPNLACAQNRLDRCILLAPGAQRHFRAISAPVEQTGVRCSEHAGPGPDGAWDRPGDGGSRNGSSIGRQAVTHRDCPSIGQTPPDPALEPCLRPTVTLPLLPWIAPISNSKSLHPRATPSLDSSPDDLPVGTAPRGRVEAMPRERTLTYSARSWEEAVECAARDAVQNGWTIVDWHWKEPQQDLLGAFIVIVEELELN